MRVDAAENFLRNAFGLRQLRVRDHMPIARIEVLESDMSVLVDPCARARVVSRFKELGYTYVTVDLAGFRSGSLNELPPAPRANQESAPPASSRSA